jgi:hypothetical protein
MQKNLENVGVVEALRENVADGIALLKKNFKNVEKNTLPVNKILVEKTWWTDIKNPNQILHVDWDSSWNEACALVLEVFGLPGQRYYYRPLDNHMMIIFKSEKDTQLCRILLSEVL